MNHHHQNEERRVPDTRPPELTAALRGMATGGATKITTVRRRDEVVSLITFELDELLVAEITRGGAWVSPQLFAYQLSTASGAIPIVDIRAHAGAAATAEPPRLAVSIAAKAGQPLRMAGALYQGLIHQQVNAALLGGMDTCAGAEHTGPVGSSSPVPGSGSPCHAARGTGQKNPPAAIASPSRR